MKILVPIKRVVDGNVRVRLDASGTRIETAQIKMGMNPFDEVAVEAALRLKEAGQARDIFVISIGPAAAAETLRTALAMGADRALLVKTDDAVDPPVVAAILAAICNTERPDLVLAGRQAIDDDAAQVGPMMAALLNWPQAIGVSHLGIADGNVEAGCETETGLRALRLTMPAVIGVDLKLNEPRYVSLPGLMKAKKKPLEEKTPADCHVDPRPRLKILSVREAPSRPPGRMVDSASALVATLQEKGIWPCRS